MATFDATTMAVTFAGALFDPAILPGLATEPVFSLLRSRESEYATFDNSTDAMLGAALFVNELKVSSVSDDVIFFADTTLAVEGASGKLLEGALKDISLELVTGEFVGNLDVMFINAADSPLLADYAAFPGIKMVRLLDPVAAVDFAVATEMFSTNGQTLETGFVSLLQVPVPLPGTMLLILLGVTICVVIPPLRRGAGREFGSKDQLVRPVHVRNAT